MFKSTSPRIPRKQRHSSHLFVCLVCPGKGREGRRDGGEGVGGGGGEHPAAEVLFSKKKEE